MTNFEKIEKFMDAELLKKKAGRFDFIGRNSSAYKMVIEAIKNPGTKIRASRIYSRSQQAHYNDVTYILKGADVAHTSGNDAPRGGISGDFVTVK